jgi:hypothetical protein
MRSNSAHPASLIAADRTWPPSEVAATANARKPPIHPLPNHHRPPNPRYPFTGSSTGSAEVVDGEREAVRR